MLYFKNEQEKKLFFEVMARMDRSYDPDKRAISSWRGENGYHSTLVNQTVHSTRDSLTYAYELLNRDAAGDRERRCRRPTGTGLTSAARSCCEYCSSIRKSCRQI